MAPSIIAAVFVFAAGDDEANRSMMERCLADMGRAVLDAGGVRPYIGVGRFCDDICDIHFSYDQAVYAAESLSGGMGRGRCGGDGYLLRYDDTIQSTGSTIIPSTLSTGSSTA
jgi:hypothetical protein